MESSRSWSATAFHNALPDGRANGRLSAGMDELVFSAENVPPLKLPLRDLDLRFGGFNNQQAYLSHPQLPEWTFLCTDPALLADECIAAHPVHRRHAKRTRRKAKAWPWPLKAMMALTVLFVSGVAALWIFRKEVTAWTAEKIPVSVEQKIGETVYQQVQSTSRPAADPELQKKLDAITARLVPAIPDKRWELKFHIVENEMINAFAIPGGHIVVHTGLIKKAKRPEEIAGVLAHEIAHVTHRHSLRNIVSSLGTTAIFQALFGDTSGIVASAGELLEQKYSRDFEREADETGFRYLLSANIDPQGMIDFFATLRAEEEKTGMSMTGALEYFSTHPATQDRIESLKSLMKTIPAGRQFEPLPPVEAK